MTLPPGPAPDGGTRSPLDALVRFCLEQRLIVLLGVLFLVGWILRVAPFDWRLDWMPRDPVPVDAIPDLGENQQIVFSDWPGRSPQDVEDQITYPLTVALLGVPGVRTVRSLSMFGFSTIYVIFEEDVEFYWSRSRVLERLASLSEGTLPAGVRPALGPDATPLGQVFWYTLEGRDPDDRATGGWDLHELRSVQDWIVRYALASAEGISEIASIGGFVQEYQIDVDPDAMRAHGVTLQEVFESVRMSNLDVGARTIEINRVEYVVRGLGFVHSLEDLERTVVRVNDNVPIYVKDVAHVTLGPALRRGALDDGGSEAVGGVAVVRYGYNPLAAIGNLKHEIERISPGLPAKAFVDYRLVTTEEVAAFAAARGFAAYDGPQLVHEAWLAWLRSTPRAEWPAWITSSRLTIVPFYDRTGLIHETLATLSDALTDEVLITVLVIVLLMMHLTSSLLVGMLLPLGVGSSFVLMKVFDIDANVVALSGIAIAIGTMVDVGIVVSENILRRLGESAPGESRLEVVHRATCEVGGAVLTAIATTVVGFLPVFAMTGAEGRLFRPLAFTKTFALCASVVLVIVVLPPLAYLALRRPRERTGRLRQTARSFGRVLVVVVGLVVLARHWSPLGAGVGAGRNLVFVAGTILGLLVLFRGFQAVYPRLLGWCLHHKLLALTPAAVIVVLGLAAWLGFGRVFGAVPATLERLGGDGSRFERTLLWTRGTEAFPGLGKEFMPDLDEGSFLWMPSTMAHASIGEALDVLQLQNRAIAAIPEVDAVVGKLGRADSALDPAPIGMIETVITYLPEYAADERGHALRFRYDEAAGEFERDEHGELIPDEDGQPFRQWRDHVHSPDDIWTEIVAAAEIPGTTTAPKLQPIAARLVMLQSGMRAPMGIKVRGPDLETIEEVGLELERLLKQVPGVKPEAVLADRIVGKPYLEIELDREALARYGLHVRTVQEVIEVAVGGKTLTTTVEGRERYPVRVRYSRELRDDLEGLERILVPTPSGPQIPLSQLSEIRFVRGPQAIKSEDTLLVGYVIFDKLSGWAEVDVVENCQRFLEERIASGELELPRGVSYVFAGSYENQVRAQRTLSVVLPAALLLIVVLLYLQFRSMATTLVVWSGVLVAWGGGFILLWMYSQPWFLDFEVLGSSMRELFQVAPRNLSVAVWVGFLALFGIATDDGVVMATYLRQGLAEHPPGTIAELRATTVEAGRRRVRPCLMTTATTLLALLPVITSTGRGSDVLVPMAIPSFGGMVVELATMLVVPVLSCWIAERRLRRAPGGATA